MAMDLVRQTCRMAWNFWFKVYISKTCKSNLISTLFYITNLLDNRDFFYFIFIFKECVLKPISREVCVLLTCAVVHPDSTSTTH